MRHSDVKAWIWMSSGKKVWIVMNCDELFDWKAQNKLSSGWLFCLRLEWNQRFAHWTKEFSKSFLLTKWNDLIKVYFKCGSKHSIYIFIKYYNESNQYGSNQKKWIKCQFFAIITKPFTSDFNWNNCNGKCRISALRKSWELCLLLFKPKTIFIYWHLHHAGLAASF